MRPGDCGTHQLPADGTPDREAVDQFADFLRECAERGPQAVAKDPAWHPYLFSYGTPPVG